MIERTPLASTSTKIRNIASIVGLSALMVATAVMLSACAADGSQGGSKSDAKYSSGGSDAYGGVYGSRKMSGFRPH